MRTHAWLEARAGLPRAVDWLADGERTRLAAMRFPRRRHDFRRGRWTAKRALARTLGLPDDEATLASLEIDADEQGAPLARRHGARLACDLSLSHRAGAALCAIGPAGSRIGCDVEWVEPRSSAFAAHFLSGAEQRWIEGRPPERRAECANLLWSAKESAVKALRTGLDVDVRRLGVDFSSETAPTETAGRFRVAVPGVDGSLHGTWGRHAGWLWTVVSPEPARLQIVG